MIKMAHLLTLYIMHLAISSEGAPLRVKRLPDAAAAAVATTKWPGAAQTFFAVSIPNLATTTSTASSISIFIPIQSNSQMMQLGKVETVPALSLAPISISSPAPGSVVSDKKPELKPTTATILSTEIMTQVMSSTVTRSVTTFIPVPVTLSGETLAAFVTTTVLQPSTVVSLSTIRSTFSTIVTASPSPDHADASKASTSAPISTSRGTSSHKDYIQHQSSAVIPICAVLIPLVIFGIVVAMFWRKVLTLKLKSFLSKAPQPEEATPIPPKELCTCQDLVANYIAQLPVPSTKPALSKLRIPTFASRTESAYSTEKTGASRTRSIAGDSLSPSTPTTRKLRHAQALSAFSRIVPSRVAWVSRKPQQPVPPAAAATPGDSPAESPYVFK